MKREKIIEILDKDKNLECKYDFTQEKEVTMS